jgi:16S rRNA (adenine1518-N6/adenine1519-N6)-dimethyltransferase
MEAPAVGPLVPASARDVTEALKNLGLRPSRQLGQSFLIDPFIADGEAALVDQPRDAPIIEIGGGLGILTAALIRRGYTDVRVLELDARLARRLAGAFGGQVRVEEADALDAPLGTPAAVVGNLPFAVATPILIRLLKARVPRIVAIVQNEVAERIAAGPGSGVYGRLSILTHLFAEVELFRTLGPACFHPRPAVNSRLIALTARPDPLAVRSVPRLEETVRQLFSSRRKQLGNLLPRVTPEPDEVARRAAWPTGWRRMRPEELPPEAFFALSDALT